MSNYCALPRLAAWCAVLVFPALVQAQTLADRVPADTVLYAGWRGVESPGPGYQGSHLQAVLADSNVPAVIENFLPVVLDIIAQKNPEAAEGVEAIRTLGGPMWRHPTAIAFVGVDIHPQRPPTPKLVLLCEAGNEAAAVKNKIDQLFAKSGKPPFPIHVLNQGGLVAVVVGYADPKDAIPEAGGKSLANNPEFVKALQQVSKDGFLTLYVDVEKALSLAELGMQLAPPEIQKNWGMIRDKLGLAGIKRAIFTEGFDGKDWASQAFIAAPAPRAGLIGKLLEGKELSKDIVDAIPENAAIAGAGHLDIAGLVDAIMEGVAALEPRAAKQMTEALQQANQIVGFDIQKDLLGSLGGEWAFYNDPAVAGNGMVGLTIVNHVKDAATLEQALGKLEIFFNMTVAQQLRREKVTIAFRQVKIGQANVHYLGLPLVNPAWAVQNGNLYIGMYPEVVGAAAAHVPGTGKSIATNPGFAALKQRLGQHPVSSFQFVDLPRLAPENYSAWLVITHVANVADIFGIPAPVVILPPLDKLMAHLSPTGQVTWADADGIHGSAIAPFPGAEIFGTNPTTFMIGEMGAAMSLFQARRASSTRFQAEMEREAIRSTTRPSR